MKNEKYSAGFTIVELIAVITILALLLVLIVPAITNTISNSKKTIRDSKLGVIEVAGAKYAEEVINTFQNCNNTQDSAFLANNCRITLQELIDSGHLESEESIIDPDTNENFDNDIIICFDYERTEALAYIEKKGGPYSCPASSTPPITSLKKMLVTFNYQSDISGIREKTVTQSEPYGSLPIPTKEDYFFEGWYTDPYGGDKVEATTIVTRTRSHILYAHWRSLVNTITFESNGGTPIPEQTYRESVSALPVPTRSGYIFDGWYSSFSSEGKVTAPFTITEDMTLYAQWSIDTTEYTLTFKDGSTIHKTQKYRTGSTASDFASISKPGYSFKGWYTASSGGEKKDSIVITADTTLYAHWEENGIMIARTDNEYIWKHKEDVKEIVFETTLEPKTDAIYSYDLSTSKDKSTMGYLVPYSSDNTKFVLYIQSNGKTKANPDSSYLFYRFRNLESITGISNLDTSKVTNMHGMFMMCKNLISIDVSGFNTSNVTDMGYMFSMYNNTDGMTSQLISITGLQNFNTSKVTNMEQMFCGCKNLSSLNLSSFDTGNVTSMRSMFDMSDENDSTASRLTSITFSSKFNTKKVTLMNQMFRACINLTSLNLTSFDTSNVTDMNSMFNRCKSLTSLNLSNFDTSKVTNMSYLFDMHDENIKTPSKLASITFSSKFNTQNVTTMAIMFRACVNLTSLDLTSFDTSNVTNMNQMFNMYCNDNATLSKLASITFSNKFNTSKVTGMAYMFQYCRALTSLNLSNFNTSNVTDMGCMFRGCMSLTSLNLSSFDTNKVIYMNSMFNMYNSYDNKSSNLTTITFSSKFNTQSAKFMEYMFQACKKLTALDLSSFNTQNVTNMAGMFNMYKADDASLSSLRTIKLSSKFNTRNVTSMEYMFQHCHSLTSLDLSSFDTSNVTAMQYMFRSCLSLTSLNLSTFDTSKVTNMGSMFNMYHSGNSTVSKLTTITFSSKFNTQNVTTMQYMFQLCKNLTTLDLSSFDTRNVTDMSYMFYMNDSNITTTSKLSSIRFSSKFNTQNVTNMYGMFRGCKNLTSLDLSSFDTRNVKNMAVMFEMWDANDSTISRLTSITLSSNFMGNKLERADSMFSDCQNLKSIDLSNFNTPIITNTGYMFWRCKNLTKINLRKFSTSNITNNSNMFYSVPSTIIITVGNTTTRQWIINSSSLTTSNFTIG